VIGLVTSCSIDVEGFQTGQVYLKEELAVEGTSILISTGGKAGAAPDKPAIGDKMAVPDAATVLSRFPARKK
jgi:hypothetical protein